ncbi:pilin [Niallia taxi]|nr:pilin [Niallia taxi]MDE5055248.1 pilin [Niallia taxi]
MNFAIQKAKMVRDIPYYLTAAFMVYLFTSVPENALAAWKKAGISPQGNVENSKIFDDLNNVIYLITAVGGFWALGCLIFSGMKLSAAQGGNPQARTQGIIGLVMAGVGVFVIVKAKTIAGYFAGFGA